MGVDRPQNVSIFIVLGGFFGLCFAFFQFLRVRAIPISIPDEERPGSSEMARIQRVDEEKQAYKTPKEINAILKKINVLVQQGARTFLFAEYRICFMFVLLLSVVIIVLVSHTGEPGSSANGFVWSRGSFAFCAFFVGAVCSILSGYVGMMIATYANARTAVQGYKKPESEGWRGAFNTAMNAGAVAGFALCGLAILILYFLCCLFELHWHSNTTEDCKNLFECIAGFGLGGSCIAMFGRVGGGIFTKAADVGADLAGKVVAGIPEDDPRNPAVIADNVGDNVGDVAGMGADLFGSFAEASCACLIVGGTSHELVSEGWGALMFPLVISATGIYCGILTHFVATDIWPVRNEANVLRALKMQLFTSTILITGVIWPVIIGFMPHHFYFRDTTDPTLIIYHGNHTKTFFSICVGLWGGCAIGFITEYFTSHAYQPTQELARSSETGPATVIIYGIALGYKSAVLPIFILCVDIFVSFYLLGMYGVALCALGMLSSLSSCLTIDVYGPVCDNAGGFAEMSQMEGVRTITDALDAAGNTTAAIGKGFAIGSAALVSLSLIGAFVTRAKEKQQEKGNSELFCGGGLDILQPITFACLVGGAMIPYWFSALTMKSVGKAAMEMVLEVKRQFETFDGLLAGTPGHKEADYDACIRIATNSSIREMVLPGLLVIISPLAVGILLGVQALAGFLCGALCSGVQLAVSMSNTGGAWDNAKKYVEAGQISFNGVTQKKGSDAHKAVVVGDTVGDPFKDTSGPAINIVMKLMAIISVVFCDFFMSINSGKGGFQIVPLKCSNSP